MTEDLMRLADDGCPIQPPCEPCCCDVGPQDYAVLMTNRYHATDPDTGEECEIIVERQIHPHVPEWDGDYEE